MGLKLFHKIKKENSRMFTVINGVFGGNGFSKVLFFAVPV